MPVITQDDRRDMMAGNVYDDIAKDGAIEVVAVRPDNIVIYYYRNSKTWADEPGAAVLNWLPIDEFVRRVGLVGVNGPLPDEEE